MHDVETAARTEMEGVAAGLEAFEERLKLLRSTLPVSDREDLMFAGEEDYDFPTEARSVIECVLTDWIAPAIRDLRDAAAYGKSPSRL